VWYLDIDASRQMKKSRDIFSSLSERDLDVHVELGDDATYAMKGEGIITFQLESIGSLDAWDMIYIPGLKNNFLSVSAMEDKGFFVTFQRGKVLIHLEKAILDTSVVVGVNKETLYRLEGKNVKNLVHDRDNPCEIWHKRLRHLHYKALFILRGIVIGLPEFSIE
jgi:hypothetical protein